MKTIITIITILLTSLSLCAQWTNYQPAEFVIGHPDFTTYYSNLSISGLNGPEAVAIDFEHGKMYVGDVGNHRVLRYSYPVRGNEPAAEIVFGQADFITDTIRGFYNRYNYYPDATASQIISPMALAVYNGDLWVLDHGNHRAVKFSQAYGITTNNPAADLVIGQDNFITRNSFCDSNSLYNPWGMCIDANGNLWIADTGNFRVLKFGNAASLVSNASAIGVVGKNNYADSSIPSSVNQSSFGIVSSIYVDKNGVLWVCDKGNNRVLKFDNLTQTPSGESASVVLGQPDFTTNAITNPGPSTFNRPYGVCGDDRGNLYVADQYNNRIMIYINADTKTSGASADNWLGSSFYSNAYTYGQKSFAPQSVSNMALDNERGKLFVADKMASRIMQFGADGSLSGIDNVWYGSGKETPNPFNLSVATEMQTIRFSFVAPSNGLLSMKVYCITGMEVATLMNDNAYLPSYTIDWDVSSISSGIYLCQMMQGGVSQTIKLIVKK